MTAPRLAITMGDPAGVGPEIVLKAIRRLNDRVKRGLLELVVVGNRRCLDSAQAQLGLMEDIPRAASPICHSLSLFEVGNNIARDVEIVPGQLSAHAGELAYLAIAQAVELAISGQVDGIVTAPLNKEALHMAGHRYAGHTELLAALTGSKDTVMMLIHEHLRVSHVTTHLPLSKVSSRLTPERLTRVVQLTVDVLRRLGIPEPRLAIAALNPHAGEDGLFGREDLEVTAPVVERLAKTGLRITGPVPGDTVFVKLNARQYDAVVAMYHDQGHIPVKLLGYRIEEETGVCTSFSGVNATLGLPIVRTSVDHGTAFDIAGKGIANETSLVDAVDLAIELCRH